MRLAQTVIRKPAVGRALKASLALLLILVTAFAAVTAKLLFENHQVNADLTLKLCKKNANGDWDTIDQAQGAVSFTATTTGIASGDVNTSHNWRFRSQQGRQVNVSLQHAGRFRLDVPDGWLNLDLPFTVEVDGKRINQSIRLTNESISTPFGQKGGQKVEIDGRSVTAILIGLATVKERDLAPPRVTGVVGGSGGLNNELVLVLEVNGRAKW
jgi:hypothetical protein